MRKLEEQVTSSAQEDDEDEDDESSFNDNPDTAVGTGPLPSAESLIRGVEELLRKQRENDEPKPIDDEESVGQFAGRLR